MAIVPASSVGALAELNVCNSLESFTRLLDSQRDLFHSQIDHLQKLVVTQCKLTGVNPLSQEMAAGALSIKIGKRPRDLLNPKATKYMQLIFSIKDTIGKKELREISVLCGVTATQVREYIAAQRSRVRKLVLLSREKTTTSAGSSASAKEDSFSSDQPKPTTEVAATNTIALRIAGECAEGPATPVDINPLQCARNAGNSINLNPVVCTQVIGNSFNHSPGECAQVLLNSANLDTDKASGNSINLNPGVYAQVMENSLNHNPGECAQVLVYSGNLNTVNVARNSNNPGVYNQVIGNSLNHNPEECAQVPVNYGNLNTVKAAENSSNSGVYTQVIGNSLNHNPGECAQVLVNSGNLSTVKGSQKDLVTSSEPKTIKGGSSCGLQEETIPGIESDEKKFLENIFNLMSKEGTFSGQVKLMEWVLQIQNSAALNWFLTKGGLAILATWLTEAALEEQTTVLLVIFKVLCHLPLHKALPVHMSAILQAVNRLRFYRTSEISNKARVLLSRWSKLFVRSQSLKKTSVINHKHNPKEGSRQQRISEILSNDPWQSELDIPEEILALDGSTENSRKSLPKKGIKLLSATADEPNGKKHSRTDASSKNKERRKVLLVEQPDRRAAGRSLQAARAVSLNHSRPMSADDIQKAKMRAMFMQDKYGVRSTDASNQPQKLDEQKPSLPPHKLVAQLPRPRIDGSRKPLCPTTEIMPQKPTPEQPVVDPSPTPEQPVVDPSPSSDSREKLGAKLKRDRIQWRMPSEVAISLAWRVGSGESSKEVGVQNQRIRREKETFYSNPPPNPKDPWDLEMDHDDSLTPEIPTEQPPDVAGDSTMAIDDDEPQPPPLPTTAGSNGAAEPDLELLAVLLKNPELVFALTAGQGTSISKEATIALLDTLKKESGNLGFNETSLPSPTPPDSARSGRRSEFATVAKPHFPASHQNPSARTTILSMPQLTVTVNPAPPNFLTHQQYPQSNSQQSLHQASSYQPMRRGSMPSTEFSAGPSSRFPANEINYNTNNPDYGAIQPRSGGVEWSNPETWDLEASVEWSNPETWNLTSRSPELGYGRRFSKESGRDDRRESCGQWNSRRRDRDQDHDRHRSGGKKRRR